MKLAAIYNVFDGYELLEGSITQLRTDGINLVDVVITVVQSVSNYGEWDNEVMGHIESLHKKGLVDITTQYIPVKYGGHKNEMAKRQRGINEAKEQGCTHYILMDVDEYYNTMQFAIAKHLLEKNNYDASSCHIYNYFKKPTYQIYPIESYQVPFIHKLYSDTSLGWMGVYPVEVDPTRKPNIVRRWKYFRSGELVMHHYSHIRKDYGKKLRNSSSKGVFNKTVEELVKMYNEWEIGKEMPLYGFKEIVEVPNYFSVPDLFTDSEKLKIISP